MFFRYPALVIASLGLMVASAHAEPPHHDGPPDGMHDMRDKIKNMTPEERKAFFEEKKAKWQAMSKQEKLAEIEKRRAERIKMMESHWNGMSDDEKIAHVENKMKCWAEGKGCNKGAMGGDHKGPGRGKPDGAPRGESQ